MTEQAAETASDRVRRPLGRELLARYAQPRVGRSLLDLATSVLPYLALLVAMYRALDYSYALVLALSVPATGFLLRIFVLFHDCSHGSFMPSKRANAWLGRFLGLFVYMPFQAWRHDHAVHHATVGDLDRRGVGDLLTLTVAEYEALPPPRRLAYRVYRSPAVLFGVGPVYGMMIRPRLFSRKDRPRTRHSVVATNVALAAIVGLVCWLFGWREYLLVQTPIALLSGAAGVWLFYVQHQFEHTYWQATDQWSYADAALHGSSYLKLPAVLQFFTGSIGLHHVHHTSARIPNYNLQRAHDENPEFHAVQTLSLRDGLRATRLKLWDEERMRLVTFGEARRRYSSASS